jgi:hypothetical protein
MIALAMLALGQSTAPAGSVPSCVAGDVNGDEALDIGDPIYLLGHLFSGGPEPIACAQGPTTSDLEAALAAMFPSGADRVEQWVQIPANSPTPLHEVFVVPPGVKFVVEGLRGFGGNELALDGELILPSAFGPGIPLWVYYPGEALQVFNPTQDQRVFSIRGYFVAHVSSPPPSFPTGSLELALSRHFPRQDGYESGTVIVGPQETAALITAPPGNGKIVVDWISLFSNATLVRAGLEEEQYQQFFPMILEPGETISFHNLESSVTKTVRFVYHTLSLE